MNIGKLYQVKKYYWLLYPSKEIAGDFAAATRHCAAAADTAAFLSERYKCNVLYIPENSIFCFLEQDGKYLKVLTSTGEIGWIRYPQDKEWTKGSIEEVNQ